ncbi:TPA: HflC protein [Patescibacteria group bacterium]|nr:HflC protein [Patescibacteria group bacterium]
MLKNEDGNVKVVKFLPHTIIIVILIIGFFTAWGTVGAGERGVLLRFSAVTGEVKDEGLYFKIPFIETVKIVNVQIQKSEVPTGSASKDLQAVSTTIAVNYQVKSDNVANLYRELRNDYTTRIIDPAVQESIKNATAQFTAEELITKRSDVCDLIYMNIKNKLESKGIIVHEVNIVNFDFSESFNESIEKKVTAEQDALASKNKLEQVKYEAQQKIEEAKGKAEAIRIEADALRSNPAVLELRALEKWNGVLPTVTGGATPFINVSK